MKHISNTQGHSRQDTRGQRHHTHTYTSWYKPALQCHVFSKLIVNSSFQLLSPPVLINTHRLHSSPPLYSLIHSRICWPPTAPLKWFTKDPKHLSADTFLCFYMVILVRHSGSLHLVSYPLLGIFSSLGFVTPYYLNFPDFTGCCFLVTLVRCPLPGLSHLTQY